MRLHRCRLIKIMLLNRELVVAVKRQINVDRDQNADDIDKTSADDRLLDCDIFCMIF